ncbi:hypothetical protein B0H19DRAFT_1171155 [Mycena capillaripes]|nr:hypothetical protein B0H19DRAFT_1171155 [Mycena capillaripes]
MIVVRRKSDIRADSLIFFAATSTAFVGLSSNIKSTYGYDATVLTGSFHLVRSIHLIILVATFPAVTTM